MIIRKYSLEDIKKKVNELSLKISAPQYLQPTYGQAIGDATPYIEVSRYGLMDYVVSERDNEYERRTTDNIDDLLYWIFESITSTMASDYELNNRIEDKDCRRIMFAKQEELLGQLNETWIERIQAEHQQILKSYPFDDLSGLRATYYRELREEGYSEIEIEKMANEKYPKNSTMEFH